MKDKNTEDAVWNGIAFGVFVTIIVGVIIDFASQIEDIRDNMPLYKDITLWALEWFIIVIGALIIYLSYRKLIKPFM